MQTSALRNRNYRIYLAGTIVSVHGVWVYRVALGWHAWQLTQSEFWVGVVAFTQFFPIVVLGPLFGVLADRFDRRRAAVAINAVGALLMLLLAGLVLLDLVGIGLLCLLSLLQGTVDGAHMPVRLALVPNLVRRRQLQSAMAINSIAFNLSRFLGPAIAGLLIATLGVASAFAFNALSNIAILAALLAIDTAAVPRNSGARTAVLRELADGLRYAGARLPVRQLLGLVALASFFGRAPLELLPAFAESVFARGSTGLAALTSSAGAGAVVAGILISRRGFRLEIRYVAAGIALAGILVALLGMTTSFWIGLCLVASLGFTLTLCGVGGQVLLQMLIDDDVRGRVSSLWGIIVFGGTAFGGLVLGTVASTWTLSATTTATGLVCTLLIWLLYRRHLPAAVP